MQNSLSCIHSDEDSSLRKYIYKKESVKVKIQHAIISGKFLSRYRAFSSVVSEPTDSRTRRLSEKF